MTTINYLCIDDQQDQSPEDFIRVLESQADLKIVRRFPQEIGAQIEMILAESAKHDNFGLLLDLRLDTEVADDGTRVPYRGPTLAQELRTRMAEEPAQSAFPILLWSINTKFAKSFFKDDTSHDLFDAIYGKDIEINSCPNLVAKQMCSFADGYSRINRACDNGKLDINLLGLTEENMSGTVASFVDHFKYIINNRARHEVALHLVSDLIKPSGLLVDEELLAARLGADIDSSKSEWDKLKVQIESAKYSGPFSDGWPRWWWFEVESWWNGLAGRRSNLRRLSALERTQFLNDQFGLSLVEAKPILPEYSSKFFSLCVATRKPVDPIDALRVANPFVKPWEDTSFVSVDAALKRIARDKWRLDPLDADRLAELKG